MMDWFRSHHGAPTDPKWMAVARRANTQPGVVAAVWWALMDHASRNESDRGSIAGLDTESLACFFGWEQQTIDAVLDALREKGMIEGNRLAAWDRRQPKREDLTATERKRNQRARLHEPTPPRDGEGVTHGHEVSRTVTTDKKREDKNTPPKSPPRGEGEVKRSEYPPEFESAWTLYPARHGDNPKKAAYRAWLVARKRGASPEQLQTATEHYAAHLRSRSKIGTEFVKRAATFYGPDEPWRDYLDAPPIRKAGSSNPWVIPYDPPTREEIERQSKVVTRCMEDFRRQKEAEQGAAERGAA